MASDKYSINVSYFIGIKCKGNTQNIRLEERQKPYYEELGMPDLRNLNLNQFKGVSNSRIS